MLTIWDLEEEPVGLTGEIIYWQKFSSNKNIISVPEYLEKHSSQLREKYLAFIYELGEYKINDKSLIEHMAYDNEFSFWWMTHLAEKSPFKSKGIFDCLCLLALEEIINKKEIKSISLVSANRDLAAALQIYCSKENIIFDFVKKNRKRKLNCIRKIYNELPFSLRGIFSLRHFFKKWSLRKTKVSEWFAGEDSIFFCTYFYNLDNKKAENGVFYSHQWGGLPDLCQRVGKTTNWLHLFINTPDNPDNKTSISWFNSFNEKSEEQGVHSFLESYLSLKILCKSLIKWSSLCIVGWKLRKVDLAFTPNNSSMWLWPFLKDEWNTSIAGPIALSNCFWVELFDEALKSIPHQSHGFYLWENQGWEHAFLRAWRIHGHGKITGVQHATVRFWGLNNFNDSRTHGTVNKRPKCLPDTLAVNGQAAWNELINGNYPADKIEKVEAVRYQYLLDYYDDSLVINTEENKISGKTSHAFKILVLGEFSINHTSKMLQCLSIVSSMLKYEINIALKPHPSCDISLHEYFELNIEIIDKPLSLVMHDFDIAFSGNSTSAGLDAHLAGLPVAVFLDEKDFNYSPLRDRPDVIFVRTPGDLSKAIECLPGKSHTQNPDDYFWLNKDLVRWKNLLHA